MVDYRIPEKANRVLNVIILGLLLILIRVWYLGVIQHDEHVEKARRPKRRTVIEKVERATIRDRFNIPLALNKIQYNAAVCYADIRQIPSVKWQVGADGKRVRVQARVRYIEELSQLLAGELQMDPQKIEDTIHGKASLFPHTPFILKEDISEEEYYRLKMLEKDWVGVRTEKGSKRCYPLGKVGCDVIGYMGAISSKEYYTIAQELKILQGYLSEREAGEMAVLPKGFQNPLEVRERMRGLQEKAYTINDCVGKAGVEGGFDADLRGYAGKKIFEVDTKGNCLRELPGGRKAISGQRLLLSMSSELQEFAEELLTRNEAVREMRHANGEADMSGPWIKGGAIVAMDPKTGEVLAMASYPRFDPNDFIPSRIPDVKASKNAAVNKWLENEKYIGEIWDGKRMLERERFEGEYVNESVPLTLDRYFEAILPAQSSALAAMKAIGTVSAAVALQEELDVLLKLSGQTKMRTLIGALYPDHPFRNPPSSEEKKAAQQALKQCPETAQRKSRLDFCFAGIKFNDDKLLVVDLCRLLADRERLPGPLCEKIGGLSLARYRDLGQSYAVIDSFLHAQMKAEFHQNAFQKWRKDNFKEFLKEKRKAAKGKKQYAKPYTEYLEQIETQMFRAFWEENRQKLLYDFIAGAESSTGELKAHALKIHQVMASLPAPLQTAFLQSMRSFEDLDRPLYGRYRSLRHTKGVQWEKHLAAAFYPLAGYGYGRSQAFRQSTPQGSVYKLVVAYEGLHERYQKLKEQHRSLVDINPLTLVDQLKATSKAGSNDQILGYTLDGQPITRFYKGGKLPRSHANIGKVDLSGAIEQSSNIYFSLLAAEHFSDPLNLITASRAFGYGEKTGIELPGEIAGVLPDDLSHNLTGLYSCAIGQHSLIATPLQTAVMISTIANKGNVFKPKVVQVIAGQESLRDYKDPFSRGSYPFQDNLAMVGIHFPLFTATQADAGSPFIWYSSPEVKRKIDLPDAVRDPIVDGMHRVISGAKGTARPQIIRALWQNRQWMQDYLELKDQVAGKTGTAEIFFKQTIDAESEAKIQNHIWFAGVSFPPEDKMAWENPELAVVVYLRFSEAGGKEAAPLAVEVVKKWREICAKHGRTAYVLPQEDAQNKQ